MPKNDQVPKSNMAIMIVTIVLDNIGKVQKH
jgi:hypothetical protein